MLFKNNNKFNIITISYPLKVEQEIAALEHLFNVGLNTFHLRKKTWFKNEIKKYLNQINQAHYPKIMLHSHPELVFEYNLKGFHFNKDYPFQEKLANQLHQEGKLISVASHSICDMGEYELDVDYQLVSPVFSSISKPELTQTLDHTKLKDYLLLKPKSKFIALGGIDHTNITQVKDLGFDGVATLGYLWTPFKKNGDLNKLGERFIALKNCLKEII